MPKGSYEIRTCKKHGETKHVKQNRGGSRCCKCMQINVTNRRRTVKRILVEEAGGKCNNCGYDKCFAALDFHHTNPDDKSFNISGNGMSRGISKMREEAKKCILLCANCHRELEYSKFTVVG